MVLRGGGHKGQDRGGYQAHDRELYRKWEGLRSGRHRIIVADRLPRRRTPPPGVCPARASAPPTRMEPPTRRLVARLGARRPLAGIPEGTRPGDVLANCFDPPLPAAIRPGKSARGSVS